MQRRSAFFNNRPLFLHARLFRCSTLLAAAAVAVAASPSYAATCESLLGSKLPNVTITIAQAVPAGTYTPPGSKVAFPDLPAFCRVVATITPVPDSSIVIEVWLPTTTWNGRYQQVGNHGWAGVIYWSEMAPQLRRGFATGATDDGHISTSPNPFDVSWAFGHPAKLEDIAWRAVHELAENAKKLIAAYYAKPIVASYFNGCSNGGREGMREAHDFPADFNGILAGGAATYVTHGAAEQLILSMNLRNGGFQGADGTAALQLAEQAVTRACDANDGVTDGLIQDPNSCHWDPHSIVCKAGEDPASCLKPAQVDAIAANLRPIEDPVTHKWIFGGASEGPEFEQIRWRYNLGLSPYALSNFQVGLNDPTWNGSTFNLETDLPKLDHVLGMMNTINPDLNPFAARGGKLIQFHGWDDGAFTPGWTTSYYRQVNDIVGHGNIEETKRFYRLFMLPGVGHCGGGPGPDNFGQETQIAVSPDPDHDVVSALMQWVEKGTAPRQLITTKFKNDDPKQGIQMQRPLYPYPIEPVYNGTGSTDKADSFHPSTTAAIKEAVPSPSARNRVP